MSYDKYIAWRRLTSNGRRRRDEMSPESQAEYDSLEIAAKPLSAEEQEEAKRAYEEVTRRSPPSSDA